MTHTDQVIQLIIIAVAGAAVVMQAVVLALMFFSIKKTVGVLQTEVSDLRAAVMPILRSAQEFMGVLVRVGPKVEATTADVSEMVHGLKDRLTRVENSTMEILERVDRQSVRVDSMLSGALDQVEKAGTYVAGAVNKPLRQAAGIVASIKAVVETLRSPLPTDNGTVHSQSNNDPSL